MKNQNLNPWNPSPQTREWEEPKTKNPEPVKQTHLYLPKGETSILEPSRWEKFQTRPNQAAGLAQW